MFPRLTDSGSDLTIVAYWLEPRIAGETWITEEASRKSPGQPSACAPLSAEICVASGEVVVCLPIEQVSGRFVQCGKALLSVTLQESPQRRQKRPYPCRPGPTLSFSKKADRLVSTVKADKSKGRQIPEVLIRFLKASVVVPEHPVSLSHGRDDLGIQPSCFLVRYPGCPQKTTEPACGDESCEQL